MDDVKYHEEDCGPYVARVDLRQVLDRVVAQVGIQNRAVIDQQAALLCGDYLPTGLIEAHLTSIREGQEALKQLLLRPSIKQRTPEWYDARQQLITASDIAQALGFGKFGTQKQLIWKKCAPPSDASNDAFAQLANCPPIKWGTMYEDVAQMVYARRNHVHVHEFGLLRHPSIPHLGASPDGITDMGVMLEIKCPYRRFIDGKIPIQYYYQIQGQLEVCGLDTCDFLEVKLQEKSRDEFFADANGYTAERGIVVELQDPVTLTSTYQYSDVGWTAPMLQAFEAGILKKYPAAVLHYWTVVYYSCVRVKKDPAFVERMLTQVQGVWERILAYRQDPERMKAEIGDFPQEGGGAERRNKRKESAASDPSVYCFRRSSPAAPSANTNMDVEESMVGAEEGPSQDRATGGYAFRAPNFRREL